LKDCAINKTTVTIKGREDARIKFRKLVEFYRTRALWFLNPAQPVDMISSSSIGVLDCIAKKCSQADWIDKNCITSRKVIEKIKNEILFAKSKKQATRSCILIQKLR
jgi:hypothetical protein